jgi:hypothetical protein
MKRPFLPGIDAYDIVLGPTNAKEVQDAIEERSLLHPEATEVHIKRGACDDCDGKHLPKVKALHTRKLAN